MYHDIDRLGTDKTIGHVQVTSESITLSSPRILRDIIFRAVLVLGDTGKVHQVIVGRDECLEALLTDLRGDVYFRERFLEFLDFLQTFLLVHFLEAGTVGSRVIFHLLYLRVDRYTVLERETFLAHVAIPTYRVTII